MEEKNKCGFNVASLVLGIISVVFAFFWYITYPAGILAIVFGVKGKKKTGSKLATTGMILGIVGLSLATFDYLIMISALLLAF